MEKQKLVVLGVTGSIAAYKAADIIRRLKEKGLRVSVVMTREAEHFITPLTLSTLSQNRVYKNMFEEGSWEIEHISLAQEADVLLIAPATANIIGKIANGIADDLLTCLSMSTKAKIFVAPAMNENMFQNKIVQQNYAKLKKLGLKFINPAKGSLACGKIGEGRLAEISDIVKAVVQALK